MNLEQVIRENFDEVRLNGDNSEFILKCPKCGKEQHFYLNRLSGLGYCHRCGFKCNKSQLYRLLNIKKSQHVKPENLFKLTNRYKTITGTIKTAISYPNGTNFDFSATKAGKEALEYLRSRGITKEYIEKYKLGYCTSGWYAGRIIVPVFEGKKLVYYQARTFRGQEPKYLNPPKSYIYGKSHFVFNLDRAAKIGRAIITEGVFDAMKVGDEGICIFGKDISNYQAKKISQKKLKKIVIMLDSDAKVESIVLAKKLYSYLDETKLFVAFLEYGDPGKASSELIKNTLKKARPFRKYALLLNSVIS
ncbi:MAG: hypothetical protein DRP74_00460 [Candidatus Omnitrophota bacterium]|nr:MAG: hypothetical protein DRP74_00460 [Candidatus Omnitrophota bacterium]